MDSTVLLRERTLLLPSVSSSHKAAFTLPLALASQTVVWYAVHCHYYSSDSRWCEDVFGWLDLPGLGH